MFPEFLGIFTGIAPVNQDIHIDIPRHLRDAFRRKPPEKWRTNSWFLLHDNAPAHLSVLFKDFLAKIKVTIMKHPPILS
jgi:hypothetical protein